MQAIATTINKEYGFLLNAYQQGLAPNGTEGLDFPLLLVTNERYLATMRQSEATLQTICEKVYRATECREHFNNEFSTACLIETTPWPRPSPNTRKGPSSTTSVGTAKNWWSLAQRTSPRNWPVFSRSTQSIRWSSSWRW